MKLSDTAIIFIPTDIMEVYFDYNDIYYIRKHKKLRRKK